MVVSPATTPWRPGENARSSTVVITPSLVGRPATRALRTGCGLARRVGRVRDDDRDAGLAHLLDRAGSVAIGKVHGTDRLLDDGRGESEAPGVERGGDDAIVGREPDDHQLLGTVGPEHVLEMGRARLAGLGVAHAEAAVAVLSPGALAHDRTDDSEIGVQLGSPGASDAVDGPDAAVLLEMWRGRRMPVLGVDDRSARALGLLDEVVDAADDILPAPDVQRALGVGEVVLHVD